MGRDQSVLTVPRIEGGDRKIAVWRSNSPLVSLYQTKHNEFSLLLFSQFKFGRSEKDQLDLLDRTHDQLTVFFSERHGFGNPLNVEAPPKGGKKSARVPTKLYNEFRLPRLSDFEISWQKIIWETSCHFGAFTTGKGFLRTRKCLATHCVVEMV